MPMLIDKLLTALILPISVSLVFGLAAIGLLSLGRRRRAEMALVISLAPLWVFSTPVIAQLLLRSLEDQYASVNRNSQADVAILLGGIINRTSDDGEPGLGSGADRALQAARLYKAGRVRYILISAGNLSWEQTRVPEAEQIAYLLKEWGVPPDVLIIENQSCNTFENAARSKPIWDAYGFHSGLLVTLLSKCRVLWPYSSAPVSRSNRRQPILVVVAPCSKAVFSLSCPMPGHSRPHLSW